MTFIGGLYLLGNKPQPHCFHNVLSQLSSNPEITTIVIDIVPLLVIL